jgi:hypothetical protein
VQKMLRSLEHRGPARLLGDIDQAFDPQKIRPEIMFQRIEQKLQRIARSRLLVYESEGRYVAVVMMVVKMIVALVIVVMIVMFIGGDVQPFRCRCIARGRVESGAAQEPDQSSAGSSIRTILAAGLIRCSRAISAASVASCSVGAIRSNLVMRI